MTMSRSQRGLPLADRFLRTRAGRGAESIVRRFHRWLAAKRMAPHALDEANVERFLGAPFRKAVDPQTAVDAKRGFFAYLDWLYRRGYLGFDPRSLACRGRKPLPPEAQSFLESLTPTHRSSTVSCYRSSLHRFTTWLADSGLSLQRLRRRHIEQWLIMLHDRGLHPATRTYNIIRVRIYLRWLFEQGNLCAHPDDLIRVSDFPKLPSYLPRPLPPAVDVELQKRLAASHDPRCQGLLLMRQTGLRIGELAALEYDCVRVDSQGRRFLKVPLGKLNNERLVPLTDQACRIIERLQARPGALRTYLLETTRRRKVSYSCFREALCAASEDLDGGGSITTHRLRHTYATTLLSGGMSLVGVMKLLGHRDYRMTLRYAAITQETLGREYRDAVQRLEQRYGPEVASPVSEDADALTAIADAIAWIKNHLGHAPSHQSIVRSLTKRLQRIQAQLHDLISDTGP
jgi:site-specific recombinase XerD